MKIRFFLIMVSLLLSLLTQANAFSDKERAAIGRILAADPKGQGDVKPAPDTIHKQQIKQNTDPETVNKPSSLEIFYRLGRVKERPLPFSNPGKMERQVRQRDQRIKKLFGKEKENE